LRKTGNRWCACLFVVAFASLAFAQKVKVGYDKSVDFSKYKTYSWAAPAMPPTRPLLYEAVIAAIDGELRSKGLQPNEKDGDLVLTAAGGLDFQIAVSGGAPVPSTFSGMPPPMNGPMWAGGQGAGQLMGAVPDGTLMLQFVDRSTNQLVWSGTVTQKLDIERKQKSLELAAKAAVKLLKQFPPKGSSSK